MADRILDESRRPSVVEAPAYEASASAQRLVAVLWGAFGLSVLYVVIVWLTIANHPYGNAVGFFVMNAGLLAVRLFVVKLVTRFLRRGKLAAAVVALLMSIGGVAYGVFTFEPDSAFRVLGLREVYYAASVLNIVIGATGVVLSWMALRDFRGASQGSLAR